MVVKKLGGAANTNSLKFLPICHWPLIDFSGGCVEVATSADGG
jgi:hypothetical protein